MMYDRIVTSVLGPVSFLMKFPFNQKKKNGFSNVSINGLKTLPCAYPKKKKKYIALLAMELDLIPRFMVTACAT